MLFVAEAALALYQRDIVLGTDAVQKWYGRCWPNPTDTAIDVRNHVTFLEHSATSPDYLEDIVRVNNLLGSFVPVSGTSHCIRASSVLEQEVALRLSQYADGAHVVVITSPPSEAMEVLLDQGRSPGGWPRLGELLLAHGAPPVQHRHWGHLPGPFGGEISTGDEPRDLLSALAWLQSELEGLGPSPHPSYIWGIQFG